MTSIIKFLNVSNNTKLDITSSNDLYLYCNDNNLYFKDEKIDYEESNPGYCTLAPFINNLVINTYRYMYLAYQNLNNDIFFIVNEQINVTHINLIQGSNLSTTYIIQFYNDKNKIGNDISITLNYKSIKYELTDEIFLEKNFKLKLKIKENNIVINNQEVLLLCEGYYPSHRNYTSNSSTIYYNKGNIGIGTNNPTSLLNIYNGTLKLEDNENNYININNSVYCSKNLIINNHLEIENDKSNIKTPIFEMKTPTNHSNIKLYIQSDTGNNDTNFTDSSLSNHSITENSSVKHSSDKLLFGTSSIYFNGSTDYLSIPNSNDFNLGSNDFTIETWINLSSYMNWSAIVSKAERVFVLGDMGISPWGSSSEEYFKQEAKWIWNTPTARISAVTNIKIPFTYEYYSPNDLEATMYVNIDNEGEIYVNDNKIVTTWPDGGWMGNTGIFNIDLVAGVNKIKIIAFNASSAPNPAGLIVSVVDSINNDSLFVSNGDWKISNASSYTLTHNGTDKKIYFWYSTTGSGWDSYITGTTQLNLNTWYHIAVTRENNGLRIFINSYIDSEKFLVDNYIIFKSTNNLYIGCEGEGTGNFINGYLDNIRITKNEALYTDNFNSYFFNGSFNIESFSFDGIDNYFEIPANIAPQLAGSDFTIEFWTKLSSQGNHSIYSQGSSGIGNFIYIYLSYSTNSQVLVNLHSTDAHATLLNINSNNSIEKVITGNFVAPGTYEFLESYSEINAYKNRAYKYSDNLYIFAGVFKENNTTYIRLYGVDKNGDDIQDGKRFNESLTSNIRESWYNSNLTSAPTNYILTELNVESKSNFHFDNFNHFAVVYKTSTKECLFYVNGLLVSTTYHSLWNSTTIEATGEIIIGKNHLNNNNYMNGELKHLKVWNSVRTQVEIQSSINTNNFTPFIFPGIIHSDYYEFNGIDDYFEIPANIAPQLSNSSFTIEFWAKLITTTSYREIYSQGDTNVYSNYFTVSYGNGTNNELMKLDFNYHSKGWNISSYLNNWNHYSITYDVSKNTKEEVAKLYINGTFIDASLYYGNIENGTTALGFVRIGKNSNSSGGAYHLHGELKHLRVWNSVRTQSEIQSSIAIETLITSVFTNEISLDDTNIILNIVSNFNYNSYRNVLTFNGSFNEDNFEFNGIDNYFEIPENIAPQLAYSDFTIEFWIKYQNHVSWHELYNNLNSNGSIIISFNGDGTTLNVRLANGNETNYSVVSFNMSSVQEDTWYHFAIIYTKSLNNNTAIKLYINGNLYLPTNINLDGGGNPFNGSTIVGGSIRIGANKSNYAYFKGKLKHLRVWNSVRTQSEIQSNIAIETLITSDFNNYLKNFNSIGNLLLYIPMNSNYIYTSKDTFIDSSLSNHSITENSSVKHSSDKLLFGTSSIYFNGSTDYLSIPNSNDFNLGSNDFTIEAWINLSSYMTWGAIVSKANNGGANPSSYTLTHNGTDKKIYFWYSTTGSGWDSYITGTTQLNLNTWYHIAVTRENNGLRIFINSYIDSEKFLVDNYIIFKSTNNLYIGCEGEGTGNFINGYLDNIRITKNEALYTNNFNSYFFNGTFNIESFSFDGIDDYFEVPANIAPQLTESEWTIDFWIYIDSTQRSEQKIFYQDNGNSDILQLCIREYNSKLYFYLFSGYGYKNWNLEHLSFSSLDQLIHFAFVFDNSYTNVDTYYQYIKLYRNGVYWNPNYGTNDSFFTTANSSMSIGGYDNDNYFKGFLKQFRVWNSVRTQSEIQNSITDLGNGNYEPNLNDYSITLSNNLLLYIPMNSNDKNIYSTTNSFIYPNINSYSTTLSYNTILYIPMSSTDAKAADTNIYSNRILESTITSPKVTEINSMNTFEPFSFNFNGTDDYFEIPTNIAPQLSNSSFTIEFWAKLITTTSYREIYSQGDTNVYSNYFTVSYGNGTNNELMKLDFNYHSKGWNISSYLNNWNHYSITYDVSKNTKEEIAKLYINGIFIDASLYYGNIENGTTASGFIRIGKNSNSSGGSYHLYGELKHFRVYKSVKYITDFHVDLINNFTLSNFNSNSTITNNIISKVSGTDWNASVHSNESYTGSAYIKFKLLKDKDITVGFNTDPLTDATNTSIDYLIYLDNNSNIKIIIRDPQHINNSSITLNGITQNIDDIFELIYSGTTIKYYQNSILIHTTTNVPINSIFYLDTSLGHISNNQIEILKFSKLKLDSSLSDYSITLGFEDNLLLYIPMNCFDKNIYTLNSEISNSILKDEYLTGIENNLHYDNLQLYIPMNSNNKNIYAKSLIKTNINGYIKQKAIGFYSNITNPFQGTFVQSVYYHITNDTTYDTNTVNGINWTLRWCYPDNNIFDKGLFYCPLDGLYKVNANIRFDITGGNLMRLIVSINKNQDTTLMLHNIHETPSTTVQTFHISGCIRLYKNDIVSLAFLNTNSTTNFILNSDSSFSIVLINTV